MLQDGRVFAALIALVLYNSAVLAEIMRAGIQSLDRGQNEAAVALGLTYWQRMRIVILPQGLRRMLPATVSQLITLNKDTTLVSIIAIQEVMRHGRILTGLNFFGGVQAPILQVFLVHRPACSSSRTSRCRGCHGAWRSASSKRTGTTVEPVTGLEDQVVTARRTGQAGSTRRPDRLDQQPGALALIVRLWLRPRNVPKMRTLTVYGRAALTVPTLIVAR